MSNWRVDLIDEYKKNVEWCWINRHLLTATDIYNLYEATHEYEYELSRGFGHVKHIRRKHDPVYDEQCTKLAEASTLIDKANSIALKIGLKQLQDTELRIKHEDRRTMPVNQWTVLTKHER